MCGPCENIMRCIHLFAILMREAVSEITEGPDNKRGESLLYKLHLHSWLHFIITVWLILAEELREYHLAGSGFA